MRGFADHNPAVLTVYFFAVSGIAMFCMHPAVTLISLAGALLLCLLHGGFALKSSLFTLGLFVLLALLNPLFSHSGVTVLFVLNHNPVTLETLIYGVFASCSMLAVLCWFRSFSRLMTRDKLLYVCGRLSPKLALVLSMAMRYVSLLGTQAKKITQAQKALGLYREDRLRDHLRVFSILLTWALENGIITADSMAARGYGIGKRTQFAIFRFRRGDVLLLSLSLLCTVLTLAGLGALDHSFYPRFTVSVHSPAAVCSLISYGILVLLPVMTEAKEAIRWHCFLSKM
ncbi:MAG: cobalt transport protein [Oscillospiraceae bacterium]|nr:cobalt transport protein [Oscillospiraceae bacterium]